MTSETTKDLVLKALNGETPDGHYDDLMVAGTRVAYTELTVRFCRWSYMLCVMPWSTPS